MNAFDTVLVWGAGVLVTWILVPSGFDADVLHKLQVAVGVRAGGGWGWESDLVVGLSGLGYRVGV